MLLVIWASYGLCRWPTFSSLIWQDVTLRGYRITPASVSSECDVITHVTLLKVRISQADDAGKKGHTLGQGMRMGHLLSHRTVGLSVNDGEPDIS